MLQKNIDKKGRWLRFIIACLLLALALWQQSWILFAISLFVFLESLLSWCIVYQLLGINHCPVSKK